MHEKHKWGKRNRFVCFTHKPHWIRLDFCKKIYILWCLDVWVLRAHIPYRLSNKCLELWTKREVRREKQSEMTAEAETCDYFQHCFVLTTQKYPTCINEFLQSRTTTPDQWAKEEVTWEYSLPPQRLLHSFDDSHRVQMARWEMWLVFLSETSSVLYLRVWVKKSAPEGNGGLLCPSSLLSKKKQKRPDISRKSLPWTRVVETTCRSACKYCTCGTTRAGTENLLTGLLIQSRAFDWTHPEPLCSAWQERPF